MSMSTDLEKLFSMEMIHIPPKTPFKALPSAHTATFQLGLSGSEGTLIWGGGKMIYTAKLGGAAVPGPTG